MVQGDWGSSARLCCSAEYRDAHCRCRRRTERVNKQVLMVLQSTTSAVLTNSVIRLPVVVFCHWKDLVVVFFAAHAVPRMHFVTGWFPKLGKV